MAGALACLLLGLGAGSGGGRSSSPTPPPSSCLAYPPPKALSWHIHVLFDPSNTSQVNAALRLQHEFLEAFPVPEANCSFDAGDPQANRTDMCKYEIDWAPAGPFLTAQYSFFVPKAWFSRTVPWVTSRRGALDVLVHPLSGCETEDHLQWPMWSGKEHKLDPSCFHCEYPGCAVRPSPPPGRSSISSSAKSGGTSAVADGWSGRRGKGVASGSKDKSSTTSSSGGGGGSTSSTGDVRVGAIRWDNWNGRSLPTSAQTANCMSPSRWHSRVPFCGEVVNTSFVDFNCATTHAMERELGYAARAGVDFWAFVQYDANSSLSAALGHYLAAADKRGVSFAALIQVGGLPSSASDPAWPAFAARYDGYFGRAEYETVASSAAESFRSSGRAATSSGPGKRGGRQGKPRGNNHADGSGIDSGSAQIGADGSSGDGGGRKGNTDARRPLVFLFGSYAEVQARFGGAAGFAVLLKAWSARRESAGHAPPHFVWQDPSNSTFARELRAAGAVQSRSAYAIFPQGPPGESFARLGAEAEAAWSAWAAGGDDVVPLAPTGWDPRDRATGCAGWEPHGEGTAWVEAPTPAEVVGSVAAAVRWSCQHPASSATKTVLVYAWNENSEGGWLVPTLGEGEARVDALGNATRGRGWSCAAAARALPAV